MSLPRVRVLESEPALHFFHRLLCLHQARIVEFAMDLDRLEQVSLFELFDDPGVVIQPGLWHERNAEMLV